MAFFCTTENFPHPSFISAGTFIKESGWTHKQRIIDSYEIICPLKGTLPLQIENIKYSVKPGSIILIPPHTIHKGFGPTSENLQFDWIHFTLPSLDKLSISKSKSDFSDYTFLIPDYSNRLSINRIHILTNQLLDINQKNENQFYLDSTLSCVLYEITSQTKQLYDSNHIQHQELQRVREWLRIHSSDPIGLDKIANFFSYNKSYLSRIYKEKFNITITNDIERFRIEAAKSLLVETSYTVDEISNQVGYNDAKYFMKVFKKNIGLTPSQYRKTFYQRHYNQK